MGADSSTLQSIESLNTTLEDIEKKLFVIEDVHLHHERRLVVDQESGLFVDPYLALLIVTLQGCWWK